MKIVLAEFNDSMFVQGGWIPKDDAYHLHKTKCIAIGAVFKETDDSITLFPYVTPYDVAKGLVIPKTSIKRMRTLRVISTRVLRRDNET